jgi:hypothetical protein
MRFKALRKSVFSAFNDGNFNGTTCIAAKAAAVVEMGKKFS